MTKIQIGDIIIETMRMLEPPPSNSTYIGDAVFAEYDGFGIWLRTGHHRDERCTHRIYLEPKVLDNLVRFYKDMADNQP